VRRFVSLLAVLCLPLAAAACSTTDTPTGGASTTTTAATAATAGGSAAGTSAPTKVSANASSSQELQTALEAAGVTNAARWAGEIMEYRPYDASDTSLAKLKGELQKYNPGTDTLTKIMSVLQP
jgi:hypothetical protein